MDKWSDLEYSKCLIFKQIFEDIVSKGDYILIETPAYPGVTSVVSWLYITILHILPPVVCGRVHVLFALFCVCLRVCPTHIVFCFCFVFLRLVFPMLPVSLNCPFLIAPSVFSNFYLPIRKCVFLLEAQKYASFLAHTISVILATQIWAGFEL